MICELIVTKPLPGIVRISAKIFSISSGLNAVALRMSKTASLLITSSGSFRSVSIKFRSSSSVRPMESSAPASTVS